jgi:NAD(P)-dependent dehydrogenase (short-subunit alcohol dehydrogenase family)
MNAMMPSTAIVTGAASGIARACVLRCVAQGHSGEVIEVNGGFYFD